MPIATLVIKDQVNVKINGVDPVTRNKLVSALKYRVPNAFHIPSVKLGRWDGTVSFCSVGGGTFLNVLDKIVPVLESSNYSIEIEDKRPDTSFVFPIIDEFFLSEYTWPEKHRLAGEPIILEEHQLEIINAFLDNPQSIVEAATGAGKTIVTAALSKIVETYGRSIIIVPNKDLVNQTEKDYKNLGLDVGVFYGKRKEWTKKHTICTWQSLMNLNKNTKSGEADIPIHEFIDGVVCVMVDEAHGAKGAELKSLMCGPFANIPLRWGMTGTIPKEEHEALCLLIGIGPKVAEVQTYELQEKGFLAQCEIDIVQTVDDHLDFSNYTDEREYLLEDDDRLERFARYLRKIADESGNTFVLVEKRETGKKLAALLGCKFVYGLVKSEKREEEYATFHDTDNKITVATFGVAAVGISINRLFNIVIFEPGKAFVRVMQSLGRGLRRAEDKNFVKLTDYCSSLKYSKRHLTVRKSYYSEKKQPFKLIKLPHSA